MNLIDGIKIDVTSAELKTTLEQRRDHHREKTAFYKQQVANMEQQGVAQHNVTNDPVASLKSSWRQHEERQAFFAYLAEHVIPEATYRLSEHDLTRLELLSKYL